ncbi:MAG TPA: flavodoxin family protein [Patescibacteria group bacterium]|nr:flavodoxin family protein [Patescibacteria group bacterium]
MKCLAIQSSPNLDGLTATLAKAVLEGFEGAGGDVEIINLNEMGVKTCIACDDGWGQCREGDCILEDDFEEIRAKIGGADAFVFATPVYWGDLSESAKVFLDRLRRCETWSRRGTCKGRKAIGIASAGGSGNGAAKALLNLEEYLKRVGFDVFDLVPVTKFSKDHKIPMLRETGRRLFEIIGEQ